MRRIDVATPSRRYPVLIGPGLLDDLGALARDALGRPVPRAFLAYDEALPDACVERVGRSLGAAVPRGPVRALEHHKTLAVVGILVYQMGVARLERTDPVIALGGGLVGDLAGFAAAIYRRGVPWINCPTTLLAMVDAAVGGKTGANLQFDRGGMAKNLVGAFHQPSLVIADTEVLRTLPDRQLRSGLAECVKHALIAGAFGDASLLEWTERCIPGLLARDSAPLVELVARNVALKAAVVRQDEREEAPEGGRALLNLGHTFAHAIEPLAHLTPDGNPDHAPLHHGEAVGLGLIAACRAAERLGLTPAGLGDRVSSLLRSIGLPCAVAGLPPGPQLLDRMGHDKKVRGGKLRLVLPTGPGTCATVDDPAPDIVEAGWDAIRA